MPPEPPYPGTDRPISAAERAQLQAQARTLERMAQALDAALLRLAATV